MENDFVSNRVKKLLSDPKSKKTLMDAIYKERGTLRLSKNAKIADEVLQYMIFSGKFDSLTPQEMIDKYVQPIFGDEILQEIKTFYEKQ